MRQYGFDAFGVCEFRVLAERLLPCRAAARLPAGALRVLVVLFPYRFPEKGERNLSRYACVEDYHRAGGRVLGKLAEALAARLPGYAFVPFIDNSPLPEVEAAARCGLGVIGDHGLLIHPVYGSWVFTGAIVTDAPLPLSEREPAGCLHCGACAAACPGNCLPGTGREGCLSALTQKKGELTAKEAASLRNGGLAWGCDVCQEVCPMNRQAVIRPHPCFGWYKPRMEVGDLAELEDKAYGWRGRSVPLRNLRLLEKEEKRGSV